MNYSVHMFFFLLLVIINISNPKGSGQRMQTYFVLCTTQFYHYLYAVTINISFSFPLYCAFVIKEKKLYAACLVQQIIQNIKPASEQPQKQKNLFIILQSISLGLYICILLIQLRRKKKRLMHSGHL